MEEYVKYLPSKDGTVFHLGLKRGELANRILSVNDFPRALSIATTLDGGEEINVDNPMDYLNFKGKNISIITSFSQMTTITGRYRSIPVSIIAIGTGMPMMDTMVREARALVDGVLKIIHIGSCAAIGRSKPGDVVVATESAVCFRNPHADFFGEIDNPYCISNRTEKSNEQLTDMCIEKLHELIKAEHYESQVISGVDMTCDSYYSSSGFQDPMFFDHNTGLIQQIYMKYPNAECTQMETFQLFHLAHSAACKKYPIDAASFSIVLNHKEKNLKITQKNAEVMEDLCAKAALNVLSKVKIFHSQIFS